MKPTFFATPADFRAWLAENHASATELLVGFYKKGSKRPSVTWPESVDEALCYGFCFSANSTPMNGSPAPKITHTGSDFANSGIGGTACATCRYCWTE